MSVKTCERCDSENIKKTKEGTRGQIIHCVCGKCNHKFDIAEEHRTALFGESEIDSIGSKGFTEIMADDGTLIRLEINNDW